MNNLMEGDYVMPSKEDRLRILTLLYRSDVPIEYDTWMEKDNEGDYEEYPILIWLGTELSAGNLGDSRGKRRFDVNDFITTVGANETKWGDSSIKFHFF